MSKLFHLFPSGSPPDDADKLLITRADNTSPSGFSNYLLTWAELKATISGSNGANGLTVPGMDGEDGQDGISIPGRDGVGTPGLNGNPGADGRPSVLFIESDDPEFPMMIPGSPGINGIGGRDGLMILSQEGEDGLDGHSVQGVAGNAGAAGPSGPLIWLPSYNDDPEEPMPPIPISDKNMVYLGRKTGTGVTVGPLIWLENFEWVLWKYQIGGYNGGTPVGRFLCAAGAPSTTALTNGNTLLENATANLTSISKPGCPLAVTLSNVARSGWGTIRGESGALKQIDIRGMSGNPAVGTNPLLLEARSFFSDLTTNLPIKQIQLSVYDTLITTALSSQTFIATTYIEAWGFRRNQ